MPGCSAYMCVNRSENGYTMKVFPKDKGRREEWAAKVKRAGWKPTDNSYLCEAHFEADQWEKPRVDGKKKLKFSAVPTIFSHRKATHRRSPRKRMRSRSESPRKTVRQIFSDHCYVTQRSQPGKDTGSDGTGKTRLPNSPEADVCSSTMDDALPCEDVSLQAKIKLLEDKLLARADVIRGLRKKVRDLVVKKAQTRLKKINAANCLQSRLKYFLNENQIASLSVRDTKGFKWSKDTVKKALQLKFACGSSGYQELLKQNHPLPSLRTLRRTLSNEESCQIKINKIC